MASSGDQPGRNVLLLDDQTYEDGVVGVRIAGPVRVDTVVSQGCRPIGETLLVTKAEEQVIHTLGGKPALEAAQNTFSELSDEEQEQVQNGSLFLGIVTNEYQDRFDRGDFSDTRRVWCRPGNGGNGDCRGSPGGADGTIPRSGRADRR